LISSTDPDWIVEHLLLDSLLFLRVLPSGIRTLLDFGAGAGLPGIPIKIVRPEVELSLLEARRRRTSFLSTALRELGLAGVRVLDARAEDVADELRGAFDAVVLRCAGSLERAIPLAAKFAVVGGAVIAAGPPKPRPLPGIHWVEVPGIHSGSIRRFAVAHGR
jgi:16S rRNA (guanine527-N7)-methyltransferase